MKFRYHDEGFEVSAEDSHLAATIEELNPGTKEWILSDDPADGYRDAPTALRFVRDQDAPVEGIDHAAGIMLGADIMQLRDGLYLDRVVEFLKSFDLASTTPSSTAGEAATAIIDSALAGQKLWNKVRGSKLFRMAQLGLLHVAHEGTINATKVPYDLIHHATTLSPVITLTTESISDQGLVHLGALTQLHTLNLRRCKKVSDQGLVHLGALSQLHTLNLMKCKNVSDEGLGHLRTLSQLHTLDLSQCDEVSDGGLAHLGALSQLHTLDLCGCKNVSDEGLAHLTALSHLHALDLRGCTNVSDKGLAHLGTLTQLHTLNLSWCQKVSDGGLAHLSALSQLHALDLEGCARVSNEGLAHLRPLAQLHTLNLRNCKKVSRKGRLHALAQLVTVGQ